MTLLKVSRVHFPVTVLGPGRRIGIWVQGCSIGCQGCVSRDTWPAAGGRAVAVDALLAELGQYDGEIDGVTISGGEPFEQPEALAELLLGLRIRLPEADILCYSGLPQRRLRRDFPHLLAQLDALISEPFVQRRPGGGPWRGSDNQPLLLLTERGRSRFADADSAAAGMQLSEADGAVYLIGVPRRGDLARLAAELAGRGISLSGSSWS